MILYITRKHPPSVGGMQRQSQGLVESLGTLVPIHVVRWSRSQIWLPFFLIYSFIIACFSLLTHRDRLVFMGDLALSPMAVFLKRVFRVPAISYAYGLDVTWPNRLYQKLVTPFFSKLDHIVCISTYTQGLLHAHGVSSEKTSVVHPGISRTNATLIPENQPRFELSEGRQVPRSAKLILYVGRLVPRKGCSYLVDEILPRLASCRSDWHCLVVGDGPELGKVEQLVRDRALHSKVTLLGQISDKELMAVYAAGHMLLMPNLAVPGDVEGFGIVALEARSAGLPVVAYDVDGISDSFVHPEDGVLVEPGDPDAFVDAIARTLDADLSVEARQARRERVFEHFGWPVIAGRLLRCVEPFLLNR